jgi:hypothetical protein
MNRAILLLFLLTGCAQAPRMPVDVAIIPNDCANKEAIIRWLDSVVATPKTVFESEETYDQTRSSVKARIWSIRYNCQRIVRR